MENQEFKKQLIVRALCLAKKMMRLADKFPYKQSSRVITNQLFRAITSVGANIVEAQAASSKKDFVNFLNHALKSGNEGKFWFLLAKDLDPKFISEIDFLIQETDELVKILGSSIATLKGKKKL